MKFDEPNSEANVDEEVQADLTILNLIMPVIIERLIDEGKIDVDKLSDQSYIWSVVRQNLDVIGDFGSIVSIEDEFLETAREAVANERKFTAVILVATAIEHIINLFYRKLLEKRLPVNTITELIRNTAHTKLGWIFLLATDQELPNDIAKRVRQLIEVRNSIVHYKAVPTDYMDDEVSGTYNSLERQVNALNFESILSLPHELRVVLEAIIEERYPERKLARNAAKTILNR